MFKKFTRKDSRNPYPIHNRKHDALPWGRPLLSSDENKNEIKNEISNQSIRSVYDINYLNNEHESPNPSIRSVYDTNYLYAQYMSFFWLITPIFTTDRSKDKGKPQRDRNREQDKIDAREGANLHVANLHFNNYYSLLQNEHMHMPSSDSFPPLLILEKSKKSKNKGKKSRDETSCEQDSRSNSRANGSDSDNESYKETTNSTNLTSLLAASKIRIGLNETAVSPSKGFFPLPPLKKTYHENPWANEFECTTSHTHQYCNDYPDLTIDYPFHSFDDDTSELQGAATEASDTDPLRQILTASNLRQAIQAGVKELSSHQENPPPTSDKDPSLTKNMVTNHEVAASDAPDDDHEGQDTSTPRKKRIPKKQKLTISVKADDQQYIPSPTTLDLWKSTVIIALSDPEYYIQPSEYDALPYDQRTPEAQVRSLNMAIQPGRALIPQAVMRHMKEHELVPEDNGKSLINTTSKAMTNTTVWYMHMELPANERQNFNYYQSVLSQTSNKITVQVRIGQQDYPLNLKIILREDDNPESEQEYKFIAKWPEYEGFKVYTLLTLIIPPYLIKIYSQAYPEQIFEFMMDLDERRDTPLYTPAIFGPVQPGEVIQESGKWIVKRLQTYNTLSSCGTVIPKDSNAIILSVKKKTLDSLGCPDLQTAIAAYGKLVLVNPTTEERRATRVEVNLLGTGHKDLEARHICKQGRCTHSHKLHKESDQLIPYVPIQDCPFHIRGTTYCNRCLDDLGQKGTTPDQKKDFFAKLVKQTISYLHLDTTHIILPRNRRMLTPALKKTSSSTILRSPNLTSPQSPIYPRQRSHRLNRRQSSKQLKPNRSKLMKTLPFSYFGTEKPRPCSESLKPSKQSKNRGNILDLKLRSDLRPISLTLLPILTQELLQIRYQQHRGPSSILSRESRLHLRDSRSGVWTHPAAKINALNDDV